MKKLIVLSWLTLLATAPAVAQHKLQVDNGPDKIGLLDVSALPVGTTILNWPASGGTILTENAGVVTINGIALNWPASNAAGVLTNDGSGNLSWAAVGGGSITGSGAANRVAYWTSASNLSSSSGLTYNGTTLSVSNNSASADALTIGNAAATGVALAMTAGLAQFSVETVPMPTVAGAKIVIPGSAVICVVTDNATTAAAGGGDHTIQYPSASKDGMFLIIINNDADQKAKSGGGALGADLDTAAKETGMWISYGGVWHRLD